MLPRDPIAASPMTMHGSTDFSSRYSKTLKQVLKWNGQTEYELLVSWCGKFDHTFIPIKTLTLTIRHLDVSAPSDMIWHLKRHKGSCPVVLEAVPPLPTSLALQMHPMLAQLTLQPVPVHRESEQAGPGQDHEWVGFRHTWHLHCFAKDLNA